ncbi:MAG: PHP domain-containing protein [Clostridia bacterium]|nr:PHP domain-containing protein [Clostridia bacterium]
MYIYEMHTHNCIASRCGRFTPEEIVKTYHEQGFDGICVTDHFFNGNCAIDRNLPWKERVEQFCLGYEKIKEEGDKVGLNIFFGFEYSVKGQPKDSMGGTDFLIYGLDKNWLLSKDESILDMSVNNFMKMVREEGGFVVQAHPFRLELSYMDHISLFPNFTDGVEVLNASPNTMGRANKLAKKYAKEYNFYRIAGSDAHQNADREYFAVLKTVNKAETIEQLISEIKDRTTKVAFKKNKFYKKR